MTHRTIRAGAAGILSIAACAGVACAGSVPAHATTGSAAAWSAFEATAPAGYASSGHGKFTVDSPTIQGSDVGKTVIISVTGKTGVATPDTSTLHLQWYDGSHWHQGTSVSTPISNGPTVGLKMPVTRAMVGQRVQLYGHLSMPSTSVGAVALKGAVVLGSSNWSASTSFTTPTATNASNLGVAEAFVYGTPQTNQDRVFSDIAATGATRVRVGIGMDKVAHQNTDGTWGYDFTEADRMVNTAISHGLRPLVMLQSLPTDFAARASGHPVTDVATGPTNDTERTAFAAYAHATVAHFASRVTEWEVWNEENTTGFWGGGSNNPAQPAPSAAAYTQLLKAVYPAVHSAQPGATVILGGMADAGGSPNIGSEDFLRQVYAAGGGGSFDAVAAHVYADARHNTTEFIDQLPVYRQIMDTNGDTHKQLWVTESGDIVGTGLATEQQQAAMLLTTWNTLNALHDHGPMFTYTLDNQNSGSDEVGFGLLDSNGDRRPVFTVMQQLAAQQS